MRNAARNYIVNIGMLVIALLLTVSAFLLWVIFPRGYFVARTVWVAIHKWSGLALTVLVVLHVILHRHWLWTMTQRYLRRGAAPASSSPRSAGQPSPPKDMG